MNLTVLGEFKYMQFYAQSQGGWCGGVSEAALAYIAQNLDAPYQPADAMGFLKDFVAMVSFGYDRITNRVAPSTPTIFMDMRRDVFVRQAKYDAPEFLSTATPGSWVTSFAGTGWAYLRLYVSDKAVGEIKPGSHWATGFFDGTVNHAGCVIWYGNEVCLFDPNVGGIRYTFTPNGGAADFTEAIDWALGLMYQKNDRMKGARSCHVVSAKATSGAPT